MTERLKNLQHAHQEMTPEQEEHLRDRIAEVRRTDEAIATDELALMARKQDSADERQAIIARMPGGQIPDRLNVPHNPEKLPADRIGPDHRLLTRMEVLAFKYDWADKFPQLERHAIYTIWLPESHKHGRGLSLHATYRTPVEEKAP